MAESKTSPNNAGQVVLRVYRALAIGLLLLIIGGALSIPFIYESMTLWYKIGIDKTMLRAGQLAGLLAVVLIFVQILLAARAKFLQKLFGLANLLRWHRKNGIAIALLAISHVTLVLAPEGFSNLPIGKKYWPEMVGALLLSIVLFMAISSQFRQQLKLDYKWWKLTHRLLGYLVPLVITVHVLFVSDSFTRTVPKAAFLTTLVLVIVAVVVSKK